MKRLGLVLLVPVVVVPSAEAAFRPGTRVAGGLERPVVGVAADGAAVLAWIDFGGHVKVSVRPAGGRFGRPRRLPGSADAREIDVAVSAVGDTVVAWRRGRGLGSSIRYATGDAGDAVGHARTLPGSGSALDIHVGLADDHTRAFLWSARGRGLHRVVRASVGGRVVNVGRCCRSPSHLALSVGADGTAVAGWLAGAQGRTRRVEVAMRSSRARAFATVRRLAAPMAAASVRPAIAAGARGAAVVVWRTSSGHDVDGSRGPVVATIGGTGGFPTAAAISTSTKIAGAPAVAMNRAGRAVAVWLEGPVGRYSATAAVHTEGTTTFAPPETLGPGAYDASRTDPQVGVADDGRAVAAWGFPGPQNYGLLTAGRPSAGPWSTATRLSGGRYAARVALATAYSGRAIAAWTEDSPPRNGGIFAAAGNAG